jgi:predicted GNAT family N-acyltransferase
MATKPRYTFTTKMHAPPSITKTSLIYPTNTIPGAKDGRPAGNDPVFTDAMIVRDRVFIVEQSCSADAEIDADDRRSWEWVVYARLQTASDDDDAPSSQKKEDEKEDEEIPVGVIRLVPPPHAPHETLHHPERIPDLPPYDLSHEPYVKITRVAVLKDFRGYGLSRLLMGVVEEWAARNAPAIEAAYAREGAGQQEWKGLVVLHAQVQVEKMYARLGYRTDQALGVWDEEGIDHVGMDKRLELLSVVV